MATRRDRQRAATTAEIKSAALAHIAAHGAADLSIRGIAREIGMSPAGLYRYFDGLDALVTELLVDAYRDLADAVAAGAGAEGGIKQRLRSAMVAYRAWAVANPNRFLLIFGTPIPGYAAPEGGATVVQNRRLGGVFFALIAEGHASGELAVPSVERPATALEQSLAGDLGARLPADRVATVLSAWAHFHGMVTLELLQQLHFVYPDAAGFYGEQIDVLLRRW